MLENGETQAADSQVSGVQRDEPQIDESRKAEVSRWIKVIQGDKAHWKDDFKRMRECMMFAKFGADANWVQSKNYTANIVQRVVNRRVADLYAKNPTVVAKVRERMEFELWDGSLESLTAAQTTLMTNPNEPSAIALMADVAAGTQRKQLFEKIAKTLEIVAKYYQSEQEPSYKRSIKRGVRRALVTGVAYCELDFQRLLEKRPEITQQIQDVTNRLSKIESLSADAADGEMQEGDAEKEQLRYALETLQSEEEVTVREGPIYDWSIGSTEIIVDRNCRQLNGFIGAGHVTREIPLTAKQIQETYGVDIRKGQSQRSTDVGGTPAVNTSDGDGASSPEQANDATKYNVWKIWDKRTGTQFVICENWPDYIVAPRSPDVQLDRFWPIYVLEFNPVEDDDAPADENWMQTETKRRIHGLSDVELIRDMQSEYNRVRQGLREHRIANRPAIITALGSLEDGDLNQLGSHAANDVLQFAALGPSQKISDLLMAKPVVPIDPNIYDASQAFDDLQRTQGSQEANIGGLTGATATEASIAEGSRIGDSQSNKDDLDELLTELARGTGQVLLLEMSSNQVKKIAGPGAVWPEFTAQDVAEEVYLAVKAGSSGRPNRELEVANMQRVAPFLLQVPGIQPRWLAEKLLDRLDDDTNIEDAFLEGLPSILAQNAARGGQAQAGPSESDSGSGSGQFSDPSQQGNAGADNAPRPDMQSPNGQPEFSVGRPVQ